jgi:hypothetical protein
MNNKQKMVVLVMVILAGGIFITNKWFVDRFFGVFLHMFFRLMPIVIIGGVLIYALKDSGRS